MRRALVLAGVLFAGLLVAVPALAAAAGGEVERELAFALEAEGFTVNVFVSNNDGDVDATMVLNRGPRVAYYSTPAKVTAERVTARFGSLGELDYRFAPKPNGSVDCHGAEEGEAVFEGTFAFTGENGYIHIEADHAEGSFQIYPEPKNCPQERLDGAPRGITRPTRTKGRPCRREPGRAPREGSAKSSFSTKAGPARTRSPFTPPWPKSAKG